METLDGIKNIVFDFGGVLVDLDGDRCVEAFHKIGCENVAAYVEEHRVEDLFLDFEVGAINSHQFCNEVRNICCCNVMDEDITWAWNELLVGIKPEKLDLLHRMKSEYRLYALSNINEMHWEKTAELFAAYKNRVAEDYFRGGIYLSFLMHRSKPQPEIFAEMAADAGFNVGETLFIDDRKENVSAAENIGFKVFHETTGTTWMNLFERQCE